MSYFSYRNISLDPLLRDLSCNKLYWLPLFIQIAGMKENPAYMHGGRHELVRSGFLLSSQRRSQHLIEATLGSWFPGDSSPETREPSLFFFPPSLSLLPLKAFVLKEPQ